MMKLFSISVLVLSVVTMNAQSEGLELPEAFSPNGDGVNDTYVLPEEGIDILSFKVYDRWGTTVFETNETAMSWDGTDSNGQAQANGVYVYILEYRKNDEEFTQSGHLTLMR